jgi:hypothetical protein
MADPVTFVGFGGVERSLLAGVDRGEPRSVAESNQITIMFANVGRPSIARNRK